ncbi:MAG: lipoyl synthase [Candidatus Omnitrophica bacterium]|nr:lipoyl synthase [Candidatus Omnitrophota bacterium]
MACIIEDISIPEVKRLPPWFRQRIPDIKKIREMKKRFDAAGLHTVCQSASCPNMGKCWEEGVATFMILGDTCTRACRFCAVKSGQPEAVDPNEPREVALAVAGLGLKYAVITSVTRDDLADGGAQQFVDTVNAVRKACPGTKMELLIPDFLNDSDALKKIAAVKPEVIGHNIETVRRLSPSIRPQADYVRSLQVLKRIKRLTASAVFIKSGLMAGLGETDDEVVEAMQDLLDAGCDILTVGQYLAPTRTKRHVKVERFVAPEMFEFYQHKGLGLGFKYVMSAPLARSSFIAEQGYLQCVRSA